MNNAIGLLVTFMALLSLPSLIVVLAAVFCLTHDAASFEKIIGEAEDLH